MSATEAVEPWDARAASAARRRPAEHARRPDAIAAAGGQLRLLGLAGIIWYLQFFFYTMGQTKMGKAFEFSNWTLHMASIMIFSMLWGVALKEWTGTSKRTHRLIALGLVLLIGSTVIIGYGSFVKTAVGAH